MPSVWSKSLTDPLSILSLAFWVAFGVAAILARPILATLMSLGSRQTVSVHAPEGHQKKQGTPTMGGLIVVAGALAAMLIVGARDAAAVVLLVGFALIGFVDDFVVPRRFVGKRGLGWKQKILMQLAIAIAAALIARLGPLASAGLVLVVLFYSNAYNFADGLDGLAGTILLGLAGGLVALGLLTGMRTEWMVPLVALLGGILPFLFLNAPPARVFMGDVGSLPIGAVLGYVVARFGIGFFRPYDAVFRSSSIAPSSHVGVLSLLAISLLMAVELIPVPLQILSVKLRKKRLFPYTPIHHAFEKAGWPETRVVVHFALVQILASALAIGLAIGLPDAPRPMPRPVVRR